MRLELLFLTLLLGATLAGGQAVADEPTDGAQAPPPTLEERRAQRKAMRERWASMSEEERAAFRQKMREHGGPGHKAMRKRFENFSEEERAAMRERWQNMSDEERQARREKMRERRAGKRGHAGTEGPGD